MLTVAEAAQAAELPVGTVRSWITRGVFPLSPIDGDILASVPGATHWLSDRTAQRLLQIARLGRVGVGVEAAARIIFSENPAAAIAELRAALDALDEALPQRAASRAAA